MALKVKILEEDSKIVAKGILDGSVPFRFDDFGDRWRVRIGRTWQYEERDSYHVGKPKLVEASLKIYGALARFRNETERAAA